MIANEFEEAAKILPETQEEVGRANKYVAEAYAAKSTFIKHIDRILLIMP
jgi:hypothetical protein